MTEKQLDEMSEAELGDRIFNNNPRYIKPSKQKCSRFAPTIKMNYPTEEKDGERRCGRCGEFRPKEEFRREKGGYDWMCPDCHRYVDTYGD